MRVQVGIPGSRIAVRERGRHQSGHINLPNPIAALPGEQCVASDEAQRILHGSLVRPLDLRGDVRVGARAQGRHRLDRGERQVIAGNRLGARTRLLSDSGGDLAGIDRIPAMLVSEELPRDLSADLRSQYRGNRIISQLPRRLSRGNPLRHLTRKGLTSPA
jgi:hypothetical protein